MNGVRTGVRGEAAPRRGAPRIRLLQSPGRRTRPKAAD